jgi:hypothetical protein
MPLRYLAANGFIHLSECFRFRMRPETTRDFVDLSYGKPTRGPQQNSIVSFFHGEFHPGPPGPRSPDILRQNDLAFGRELGGFRHK